MKKGLLSAIIVLLTTFNATNAQQKTTLSAEIYGYQRDMVYFDCIQTPLIAQHSAAVASFFHHGHGKSRLSQLLCHDQSQVTASQNHHRAFRRHQIDLLFTRHNHTHSDPQD